MKTTKKILGFAPFAVVAVLLFASCGAEVGDTTANFGEAEKNATTTTSGSDYEVKSGDVDVSTASLSVGGWDTVEFTIESFAKLNLSTLENAVTFYSLKDNTENAAYYPMHDAALAKKLLTTSEEKSSSGITTTLTYDVNLTNVTSSEIALIVDATKLKDKSGKAVLNLDGDDVAGEETDSFIFYIDTDGSVSLNHSVDEDFCPAYGEFPETPTDLSDSDGNLTGKLRFTCDAPVNSEPAVATTTYDTSWGSTLSKIVGFQTKAANETAWNDVALSFTYHAEDDATNGYEAHTFTADTPVLAPGTQYRVIAKGVPNISAPSWYTKVFGHEGKLFYGSKEYSQVAYVGTSSTFVTSPSYIVNSYGSDATTAKTWTPAKIDDETITANQNALLSVTAKARYKTYDYQGYIYKYDAWEWEITPATGVALSSATDFVVTDSKGGKLDSTVSAVKDSDGEITKVYVELTNKNYLGTYTTGSSLSGYSSSIPTSTGTNTYPILYVGHGTKLKENVAYPTQLEFGTYENTGIPSHISGYVKVTADSSVAK